MFLRKIPWYVILIALYSPLTLLAGNIGEVGLFAANRAIIVMVLGEILLLTVLKWIYNDWQKVGFVAFLLTVLMFSYGHVYSLLEGVEFTGLIMGRHRYLLVAWVILSVSVFYFASKVKKFSAFEDTAKLVSIVLVVFSLVRLTTFYYVGWRATQERVSNEPTDQILQAGTSNEISPDVYYIILDAYGRSDVLVKDFDVDTTDFLNSLRSMGFFIADCSQSNYSHTQLSLASSLNYSYLDDFVGSSVQENKDWAKLKELIRNSAVRQFFEGKNYQIVAFETGFAWTELRDADVFIENKKTFFSKNLTSFESLFLHTTIVVAFDKFGLRLEPQQNIRHYEMILSNLDALENMSVENSPKLVFAHLVIPHAPFVFNSDGSYHRDPSLSPVFENYTDEEHYNGYRQQVIFINDHILKVVEAILSNSKRPPIIVIQGDHGPSHAGGEARMSILNAYYLPDILGDRIDARITPVNTFRVILNSYFGQNLLILPDISYFSKNSDPYAYTVVPNECKP